MTTFRKIGIAAAVAILAGIGILAWLMTPARADLSVMAVAGTDPTLAEPDAQTFPTVAVAKPVGWAANAAPVAAPGLRVNRFADGLDHPRVIHTLPNGDVLVTLTNRPPGGGTGGVKGFIQGLLFARAGAGEPSPDQLVLLRDADGDGRAEIRRVLTDALSSPSGIAWRDGTLYVANHDALLKFPYRLGSATLGGPATKLMDLPAAGNHWMRNIVLAPDGGHVFVAVGSASNIGENGMDAEQGRATIWDYDLATGRPRQYAVGMRNPNGLDFNPQTGELWSTVNERDMLGSDLVPDYLTNVPVGAQYGWPWIYWGDVPDERVEAPMPAYLTEYARTPEYALGPHVAALGMAFARGGHRLGARYGNGAFVARHGSWNRVPPSGYDVVFVPFDRLGNPAGKPQPVLAGFLTGDGQTHGRPTWVAFDRTGGLLVTDDTAGIIWRVIAPGAAPAPPPPRLTGESLPPLRELSGTVGAFGQGDYARTTTTTPAR